MEDINVSGVITKHTNGKTYAYPRSRYTDPNREDLRRVDRGGKKGHQISQMWDKHHEIARLIVLGMNNQEVAAKVNCTPQTVSNVRNSPVVQDKLAILHAVRDVATGDLAHEIAEMAPMALKRIREVLETGKVHGQTASAAVIMKEANNLIDREMGKAVQRIDSRNINTTLGPSDLEAIKQRAAELRGDPTV